MATKQASWKGKAARRAKEKNEGERMQLQAGSNVFRILPNKKGPEHPPFLEILLHRDVGPDKSSVRCGKTVEGEGRCWLCDSQIAKLLKSSKASSKKLAEALTPGEVLVLQTSSIDMDEPVEAKQFRSPKAWWVSSRRLSAAVLSLLSSMRRSYEDPLRGRNISLQRTGTGWRDTRYGALEPDDEPTKVPKKILDRMKTLEELVPTYSESEQKAAYYGRPGEDEAGEPPEDDEDETPVVDTEDDEGVEGEYDEEVEDDGYEGEEEDEDDGYEDDGGEEDEDDEDETPVVDTEDDEGVEGEYDEDDSDWEEETTEEEEEEPPPPPRSARKKAAKKVVKEAAPAGKKAAKKVARGRRR